MRTVITAALAAAALAQSQNIVQIALSNPNLSDLVVALQAGGLVQTLEGPGPFTVLAPLNNGFAALGKNILDFVLNPHNTAQLDNVLTYHVASGAVYSNQLYNGEKIPTLDSKLPVAVNITGSAVFFNQAQVITADIRATNGVIHVIDGVLVPSNFALPPNSIAATAAATPQLSTLLTAVETVNLTDTLASGGPFTVFAPTNDAFNKLPAGELNYLLQHPAELANILLYHLLDHRVYAEQIQNFEKVPTLQGQDIVFIETAGGGVLINGVSNIIATNIDCTNGVVHLIDTVILPKATKEAAARWATRTATATPALPNLVELAESVPQLSTLVAAVTAGGLVSTLEGPGPFTVFAPTNDAFAALPDGVVSYLLNNTKALDTVLTYHVVAGKISSNQITDGEVVATVEGQNVTAHIVGGHVYVNDAEVVSADNQASNGIAHIIDTVLLPQGAPAAVSVLRGKGKRM